MTTNSQLDKLKADIEKASKEVQRIAEGFQSFPRNSPPDVAGQKLLDAFLNDEPFDRYVFGLQPVKLGFIDAAFKTGDMEIVTTCFGFVEQSMSQKAFYAMVKDTPQYMKIYNMLHKGRSPALIKDKTFYTKDNIPQIKENAGKETNKLVKMVMEDYVVKLNGSEPDFGIEEVDKKWGQLKTACMKREYNTINPSNLLSKSGFFSTKWKSAIDPYQAARMAHYWKAPPQLVERFAKDVKDPKEKQAIAQLPRF